MSEEVLHRLDRLCGIFFLRHVTQLAIDDEPAHGNVVVEACGVSDGCDVIQFPPRINVRTATLKGAESRSRCPGLSSQATGPRTRRIRP